MASRNMRRRSGKPSGGNRAEIFRSTWNILNFHRSATESFSEKLVDLFGASREPESKFFTRSSGYPEYYGAKLLEL